METDRGNGSAHFDAVRYDREVVRPLRANPKQLPLDFRVRYDVRCPLNDRELPRYLGEVIGYWQQRCREQEDYSRRVYVALVEAHQEVIKDPTIQLYSSAWWASYQPPEQTANTEPEPVTPLSVDTDPDDVQRHGAPPAQPVSGMVANGNAGIDLPVTAAALPANQAGDSPAADGQLLCGAVTDRVRDLEPLRIGNDVELSWIWPEWATEAKVSWDSNHKVVGLAKYRQMGCWQTSLSKELLDGELLFSVAVRGAAADHREWSEAVSVRIPGPRPEISYTVRRRWSHFWTRDYTVSFHAKRLPEVCEIIIGFSSAGVFQEKVEACHELDKFFILDDVTRLVTAPRRASGWLCCFLIQGEPTILKHPDLRTLKIRSWLP